jgi:cytochrome c-type biogenesis protein CcmH
MKRLAILLLAAVLSAPAFAIDSGPAFDDPELQQRYDRLVFELRCLMCQNNNIADSNSMIASDLRREVRELIAQGKSDAEIRTYMTDRYGDFVLYRPPVVPRTWLLWAAPALFMLGGLAAAVVIVARRARAARNDPAALDQDAGPS